MSLHLNRVVERMQGQHGIAPRDKRTIAHIACDLQDQAITCRVDYR